MIDKIKGGYFLYLFATIILIYQVSILAVSPIVWIDEVCFNSITLDHLKNNSYFFLADKSWLNGKEALAYGPVFFIINEWIIRCFGNSIFFARLLGMAAGLLIYIIIFFWLNKSCKENKVIIWIIILSLITDPFFSAGIHNGRMDSLALLFYLLSAFLIFYGLKYFSSHKSFLVWIASAVFYSMSALTTPRIIILSIPFAIFFIRLFYLKKFIKDFILRILVWISIPVAAYSVWIYSAYGNFRTFLEDFNSMRNEVPKHFEGGLNIPIEVLPLFIVAIAVFFIYLSINLKKIDWETETIFYLTFITGYYILIGGMGLYSTFVIPFFYLLIFKLVKQINIKTAYFRKSLSILLATLLVFNLSIILLKSIVLLTIDYEPRKYEPVNNFIKENIPAGAKVAGDELYYYAIVNNGYQFQLLKSYQLEFTNPEKYAREVFDYDYLVISNRYKNARPHLAECYFSHAKLQKISEFQTQRNKNLSQKLASLGIYTFALDGYDGIIYKRIR